MRCGSMGMSGRMTGGMTTSRMSSGMIIGRMNCICMTGRTTIIRGITAIDYK